MATLTARNPVYDKRSDVTVAIDNALNEWKLAYPDLRAVKAGPKRDAARAVKAALEEAKKLARQAESI